MIRIKRVYDKNTDADYKKILIDGLWPRGIKRDNIDIWLKEIAPSKDLREWYSHNADRWEEFKKRYSSELENSKYYPFLCHVATSHLSEFSYNLYRYFYHRPFLF